MSQRQALDAKASAIMFVLCMLWGLQQVVLKWAASDISALMQIALLLNSFIDIRFFQPSL